MAFTSGMLPMRDGQLLFRGHVGDEGLSVEQAQQAARQCVLNALASIKAQTGSLNAIAKVVKITVFVMSQPNFYQQPLVANGASHALTEVLGDAIGSHARSAVGVANLPMEAPVEVEVIVALQPVNADDTDACSL
jgi:enamine deaminase RidA (YjgF/YER057c/UK114 family)